MNSGGGGADGQEREAEKVEQRGKRDRTWAMVGVGGKQEEDSKRHRCFARELGRFHDAANRIRDLGRGWFGGKDDFAFKPLD